MVNFWDWSYPIFGSSQIGVVPFWVTVAWVSEMTNIDTHPKYQKTNELSAPIVRSRHRTSQYMLIRWDQGVCMMYVSFSWWLICTVRLVHCVHPGSLSLSLVVVSNQFQSLLKESDVSSQQNTSKLKFYVDEIWIEKSSLYGPGLTFKPMNLVFPIAMTSTMRIVSKMWKQFQGHQLR